MPRFVRVLPIALLVALISILPAAVQAQSAPSSSPSYPVLTAFVGPGYDIGIRDQIGDLRGRTIAAGTYTVEVYDYSDIHNFELKGDGVDRETEEEFVGHATWTVTFGPGGEYEFECDPHHDLMYGEFRAGTVAPPPPFPPPPPPPPPPPGGALHATVRANATIDLRRDGNVITGLQAGTYTIQVDDQTASHNFHLTGPGVDQSTTVSYSGTTSWTVTFSAGTYTYVCDPHSDFMRGSFTVTNGPPPPPAPPPSGNPTLLGAVRPDFTIDLKHANGSAVTQVAPGTYTIQVDDQTPNHNFHLTGPGADHATSVAGTGTVTWTVTLSAGTYTFVCDPHSDGMRGSFTVGSGPAPPPPPPPPPPPRPAPAPPGILIATVRSNDTIDVKLVSGRRPSSSGPARTRSRCATRRRNTTST